MTKKQNLLFLIFGVFFSVILRIFFQDTFYDGDLRAFFTWINTPGSFNELYATDCVCNYPFVGLLLSAGVLKLFGGSVFLYLVYLSFIDAINVLLIYYLLSKTNTSNAGFYSCLLGVLPSTWAPSSFWGQMDNFGLLVILSIFCIIYTYTSKKYSLLKRRYAIYLILVSVVFTVGILSKQLLYPSLLTVALILFIDIIVFLRFRIVQIAKYLGICLTVIIALVFFVDYLLVIPEDYISHLHRVALNGSGHIGKISGNGFNIWMLLGRSMTSSSEIPIFYSLSPLFLGILIFGLNFLVLTYYMVLYRGIHIGTKINKNMIATYLFYIALVNLSFNLFLTGTHERYLIYFFPLILIAMLIFREGKINFKKDVSFVMVILASLIYGLFVLGILLDLKFNNSHLTVLLFNFILYFVLVFDLKRGLSLKVFKEKVGIHMAKKNR